MFHMCQFHFSRCTKPEQKPNIPMGKMQKEIKSVEQRAEQDIKRLKEKLNKAEVIWNFKESAFSLS